MFFKDDHTYWVKGNALIGGSVLSNSVFTVTDSKINGIYPIFSNTVVGVDKLYEIDRLLEPDDVVSIVVGSSGLWIDPSQRSALFQDAAGTIPVTAPGQPVGLIRDLSAHGNHASQAVALNRPILGRHPASGLRQLLTYTKQFDNPIWLKGYGGAGLPPIITPNAGVAPDGSNTADRIQLSLNGGTTNGDRSRVFQRPLPTQQNSRHTVSFIVKSFDGVSTYNLVLTTPDGEANAITVTGEWTTVSYTNAVALPVGTSSIAGIGLRGAMSPVNSNTADILVSSAQFEPGTIVTPHQHAVSRYDVTEPGYSDVWYLEFDGVNDLLSTSVINWATDEVTVVYVARKNSDAAEGRLLHYGDTTTDGSWLVGLSGPPGNAPIVYGYHASRGTITAYTGMSSSMTQYAAPLSVVGSMRAKISTDMLESRINGVTLPINAGLDQGSGTYASRQLLIGRSPSAYGPFSGRIYGLFAINRVLSPSELARVEAYFASRAGVSLA